MSGQHDPSRNPDDRRRQDARADGVNLNAGGDNIVSNATIAGGDIIINKVRKWALANPLMATGAGLALVVSVFWGGSAVIGGDGHDAVDTSVVSEAGLTGARHTLEQVRTAERVADTAAWCELVQPNDSGCAESMSSSFAAKSDAYREQVGDVGLGEPEKTGDGARMQLRWQDKDQGSVGLTWAGGRWQLVANEYALLKVCKAGLFLSLVDTRNQQAKCASFSLPSV
ncbi:hypothetical protein ABT127_21480 [Streptomyces sp. NPDC001904]|uniref:hypothetical protein n=1 Tax=Streptomyces sp. NPDC001904 TaxID=3154531 RepID=UPI00331682EA